MSSDPSTGPVLPMRSRPWLVVIQWLGPLGLCVLLAWGWSPGKSVLGEVLPWSALEREVFQVGVWALLACLGTAVCQVFASRFLAAAVVADGQMPSVDALDNLPAGLFTVDLQGQFVRCNAMAAATLGMDKPGLLMSSWDRHFQLGDWERLLKAVGRGDQQVEIELEFRLHPEDRSYRRASITAKRRSMFVEVCLQDITERTRTRDYLEFLVRHDPLTKTLNRLGIERHLKKRLSTMKAGYKLGLAYMDLDGFKLVNDLYGHQAGDELLVALTKRLLQSMPRGVRLGRIGGDEFLMVFSGFELQEALQICEHLLQVISSENFEAAGSTVSIGASIGLIEVRHGSESKDAISHADNACRQAKSQGKGRVVAHGMDDQALLRHQSDLRLADDLVSQSMETNLGFQVQPILCMAAPTSHLHFEVLLQMSDHHGDSIPTMQAVSVAHTTGQMSRIDRWMLGTVLDWLRQRKAIFVARKACIFVNLSGASLNDNQMVEDILGVIEHYRDIADLLCVEVTEDVALKSLYSARQFFLRLRNLGVRVALDDFGAGYSSFTYLRHLPSDFLKIDGGLIAHINEDPANVSIVQGIINLARSLGMQTIAEWAEDAACVRTLHELGVDFVQGYAIAHPMSAQQLLSMQSSADGISDPDLQNWIRHLATNR